MSTRCRTCWRSGKDVKVRLIEIDRLGRANLANAEAFDSDELPEGASLIPVRHWLTVATAAAPVTAGAAMAGAVMAGAAMAAAATAAGAATAIGIGGLTAAGRRDAAAIAIAIAGVPTRATTGATVDRAGDACQRVTLLCEPGPPRRHARSVSGSERLAR